MLQACRSPLSVFAVEQVTPGQSVDVKDILTGRRFHTRELTASRESLHLGDVIFTRVVTVNDVSLFFGTAPYAAPPAWHMQILDWRNQLIPQAPPDAGTGRGVRQARSRPFTCRYRAAVCGTAARRRVPQQRWLLAAGKSR